MRERMMEETKNKVYDPVLGREIHPMGWLDRYGNLYECRYCQHQEEANRICEEVLHINDFEHGAEALLDSGWVQVCNDSVIYRFFTDNAKTPTLLTVEQINWLVDNIMNNGIALDCVKDSTEMVLADHAELYDSVEEGRVANYNIGGCY